MMACTVNNKDRKSILYHYGKNSAEDMEKWPRFRHLSLQTIQAVIDAEHKEPEPDPREADPRMRLADKLFPQVEWDYERDTLLDDLVQLVKDEI